MKQFCDCSQWQEYTNPNKDGKIFMWHEVGGLAGAIPITHCGYCGERLMENEKSDFMKWFDEFEKMNYPPISRQSLAYAAWLVSREVLKKEVTP